MQAPDLATAIEWAKDGKQSMVKCPAHDDGAASLHVAPGKDQPVVMTCHAGCKLDRIMEFADTSMSQIMSDKPDDTKADDIWTPAGNASHVYRYTDEKGELLYEVLRIPQQGGGKTFRQRRRDDTKRYGWNWSVEGVRRVIYRLPEVIQGISDGKIIHLVEGEKDVETLRRHGFVATTAPMGGGANKWRDEYNDMLAGATVAVIADRDATGYAHARAVREALTTVGCSVTVFEPKEGCKDITDHFQNGGTMDDLIEIIPEEQQNRVSYGVDVLDVITRELSETRWVIPNVMAQGDRLLLTGFEGHGKSQLLRQLAGQVAAGIHPWTGMPMQPQKVLVLDAENHPDQTLTSWRRLVTLAANHGRPIQPGMLKILEEWDGDLDLTSPAGFAYLTERVYADRPAMVFMGPLYNLASRDLKEDETVRKIKQAVNAARAICGTAFVLEHHSPHKGPGDKTRSVRPYGSSTFLKWPDFGFGLKPTDTDGLYELQHTRMKRVRDRHFPTHLRYGRPDTLEWPWEATMLDPQGNPL